MIRNVYDEVHQFYQQEFAGQGAVSQEWVEGFLRQKAWAGASDEELRDFWQNLKMFLLYLAYTDAEFLEDIPYQEYSRIIGWLSSHVRGFKATLKPVRRFFHVLIEFYRFLALKKLLADTTELELAAREIAGGNKVKLDDAKNSLARHASTMLTEELGQVISETIDGLMQKLSQFFQSKDFNDDFQRALFLFAGPLNSVPDSDPGDPQEFWQEFWDYFLFDYHLLANDKTPLAHFAGSFPDGFSKDESQILDELMEARFTVFTVHRVVNEDWVECINLFTEEKFRLPYPDFEYKAMKRMLFFGHVFSRETMMVNYITSVEISPNLRRRIREEGQRQKAIFDIQNPGASWQEYFARHALAFRHTVDALITLAKVNVTPFHQIGRAYPAVVAQRPAETRVHGLFTAAMPEYGFSEYDKQMAGRLWEDFWQLRGGTFRKPEAWAAALVYVYSLLNFPQGISAEQLAGDFGVAKSSVYANREKIYKTLQLSKYDPRYLNEEGLIYSLFTL